MRRTILALTLALAAAIVPWPVHAQTGPLDRTVTGDDVTVSVVSPYSQLPPSGCVPYRVNIRNDRNTPGTWNLFIQAGANMSNTGGAIFKQDLTVPANSSSAFDISVPLPVASEMGSIILTVRVTGPGLNSSDKQFFAYFYTNHTGALMPYAIIGNEVLKPLGLDPLQSAFKGSSREFYGTAVDVEKMPEDWRDYAGAAALVLRDTEWLALNSAQREAVCSYVAQGGHLTLYTSEDQQTRTPQLQLPEPDGKPGDYGFGTISLESTSSFPVDAATLLAAIRHNPAAGADNVDSNFSSWGMRETMGAIAVNGTYILLFVLVFATVVGPLNLFVFAGGDKRFRLFWTTPLISLLASLALVIGILVTDGIGGYGKQMIAFYSMPAVNREAVIQEQVARTAVLFSNRWHNDQNYLITPISQHAMNNAVAAPGYRMYSSRSNLADADDSYLQQENEFSGNWFRSRSVSGQYLQAVRPSRAVLTVLNPQAFGSQGAAPVVLSSYPQELDRVFLFDTNYHYWTCSHLQPGRKQTCVASSASEFTVFWNGMCGGAGGKLRPLLSRVRDRPGTFYASGTPAAADRLATLDEIRWRPAIGLYFGPWAISTAPEFGP